MQIISKSGRKLILNTAEEEAAIAHGIAADPDTLELSDAQFSALHKGRTGRPKAEVTKERITIRLSPDVVTSFRASGNGCQTRIDNALRDWLKNHSPG